MKKIIIGCMLLVAATAFVILATSWTIDKGTKTNFSVNGLLGVTVHGTLDIEQSAVKFDPADLKGSSASVTLKVSSISTGIGARDKHLRSADYFDEEKYPNITFRSISFSKGQGGQFIMTGNLTIKQVTKKVTIPFGFTQTGNKGMFTGNLTINRVDYGVGKEKASMGKNVKIELKIPASK